MQIEFWHIFALLLVISIPTILINVIVLQKEKKLQNLIEHQYDYVASPNVSFEHKIQAAGLTPKKVVIFGQNSFAYDEDKKKILVQSASVQEAAVLSNRELLYYELLYDEVIVASGNRYDQEVKAFDIRQLNSVENSERILIRIFSTKRSIRKLQCY